LTSIAQTLNLAAARPKDIAARYGGEEFVLLLPETDESAALLVAERCHCLIEKLKIPNEKSGVSQFLTVSIGVGTINPPAKMEPKNFIEAVDKLLYAAKHKGRNRIESRRL
jgi:diguanylate cyclase (GGDEF)-like protein